MVIQKKIALLRGLKKINDALLVKKEQMHINKGVSLDWSIHFYKLAIRT